MRVTWAVLSCLAAALLAAPAEAQTVLTVERAGSYRTLQAAMEVAAGLSDTVDVRLQRGLHAENIVTPACCAGSVTVSGGWKATFTERDENPNRRFLDGRGRNRVWELTRVDRGSLTLRNLTILGGPARSRRTPSRRRREPSGRTAAVSTPRRSTGSG